MKTPDKITAREIRAYERNQKMFMERANRRPILNPNGPTALIPAVSRKSPEWPGSGFNSSRVNPI